MTEETVRPEEGQETAVSAQPREEAGTGTACDVQPREEAGTEDRRQPQEKAGTEGGRESQSTPDGGRIPNPLPDPVQGRREVPEFSISDTGDGRWPPLADTVNLDDFDDIRDAREDDFDIRISDADDFDI